MQPLLDKLRLEVFEVAKTAMRIVRGLHMIPKATCGYVTLGKRLKVLVVNLKGQSIQGWTSVPREAAVPC